MIDRATSAVVILGLDPRTHAARMKLRSRYDHIIYRPVPLKRHGMCPRVAQCAALLLALG